MVDERIEKWMGWIEGSIKHNVLTMHLQRMAWREVAELLSANTELPESYWWEFMRDTYATTQAVAVRRQADTMRGVASLGKLVEEIGSDATRLTWDFWLSMTDSDPSDKYWPVIARKTWDNNFGGEIGAHLDPAIPQADLASLVETGAKVRHYVDRHVAHAQASPPQVTLTLDEVHEAIDVIAHLFKKYSNLLTGAAWGSLEPVIQHNWKAVFSVPWMKPNSRLVPDGGISPPSN